MEASDALAHVGVMAGELLLMTATWRFSWLVVVNGVADLVLARLYWDSFPHDRSTVGRPCEYLLVMHGIVCFCLALASCGSGMMRWRSGPSRKNVQTVAVGAAAATAGADDVTVVEEAERGRMLQFGPVSDSGRGVDAAGSAKIAVMPGPADDRRTSLWWMGEFAGGVLLAALLWVLSAKVLFEYMMVNWEWSVCAAVLPAVVAGLLRPTTAPAWLRSRRWWRRQRLPVLVSLSLGSAVAVATLLSSLSSVPGPLVPVPGAGGQVPRHIFHVRHGGTSLPAPVADTYARSTHAWQCLFAKTDGFTHTVYGLEDGMRCLDEHFPAVSELARSRPPIFRNDLSRYCLLYRHGGLYSDLDYEPLSVSV